MSQHSTRLATKRGHSVVPEPDPAPKRTKLPVEDHIIAGVAAPVLSNASTKHTLPSMTEDAQSHVARDHTSLTGTSSVAKVGSPAAFPSGGAGIEPTKLMKQGSEASIVSNAQSTATSPPGSSQESSGGTANTPAAPVDGQVQPPESLTNTAVLGDSSKAGNDSTSAPSVPRYPVRELTAEDAVLQADLQDELLADTYNIVHPVNPAVLETFSNTTDPRSLIYFSEWEFLSENATEAMRLIKDAITFQREGQYMNLSRVDTELLDIIDHNDAGVEFIIPVGGRKDEFLVCCSTGMVVNCELVNGKASGQNAARAYRIKKAYFLHHSQEFQLFIGRLGMVFNFDRVSGDFYNNAIGLQTGRQYADSPRRPPRNANAQRIEDKRRGAKTARAGKTPGTAGPSFAPIQTQLPYNAIVPIYDARKVPNFTLKTHVHELHKLPQYKQGQEDLPDGSAVVAGYVVGHNNTVGSEALYFNVQWLILLALPNVE